MPGDNAKCQFCWGNLQERGHQPWCPVVRELSVPVTEGEARTMTYTCPFCNNTGTVCENHPDLPWGGIDVSDRACHCGGAGVPCPGCCDPIPEDGTHCIEEAFLPRHLRPATEAEAGDE